MRLISRQLLLLLVLFKEADAPVVLLGGLIASPEVADLLTNVVRLILLIDLDGFKLFLDHLHGDADLPGRLQLALAVVALILQVHELLGWLDRLLDERIIRAFCHCRAFYGVERLVQAWIHVGGLDLVGGMGLGFEGQERVLWLSDILAGVV